MIEIEHTKDGITKIDNTGIELRDYLATRAMEALIIACTYQKDPWYKRVYLWFRGGSQELRQFQMPGMDGVAKLAYQQADLMLKERVPLEWKTISTITDVKGFWNESSNRT